MHLYFYNEINFLGNNYFVENEEQNEEGHAIVTISIYFSSQMIILNQARENARVPVAGNAELMTPHASEPSWIFFLRLI